MDILAGSRDAAHGEVRVGCGHHLYMERLLLSEMSVAGEGAPASAVTGVQLGLDTLKPGSYVGQGVLDAATASAARAFGWRTWEGVDEGIAHSAALRLVDICDERRQQPLWACSLYQKTLRRKGTDAGGGSLRGQTLCGGHNQSGTSEHCAQG